MTTFRADGVANQPYDSLYQSGKKLRTVQFSKTLTSGTSSAGDLFILAGPMSFDDKIKGIIASTPALTSANDNDLGFFKKNADGTFTALKTSAGASAKDLLWNGVDLSSALSYRELLYTLNTSLDEEKTIGELLGLGSDQEPDGCVYLGLTTNVANTAATARLILDVQIAEATAN
jgi:hypothetical protein